MMGASDEEAQWKDVWKLYDLDRDGKISGADFVSAVRVCGRRYTSEQLSQKTRHLGDVVSFDAFFGFMCDPYTGPTTDDLRRSLQAFDGSDTGELTIAQIRSILTTMGDKMTPEEADAVIELMPQAGDGRVKIDALTEFLTPPIPTATPNIAELTKEILREEIVKAGLPIYEPRPASTPRQLKAAISMRPKVAAKFDRKKSLFSPSAHLSEAVPMMMSSGSDDD